MAKRIFTWNYEGVKAAGDQIGPAYYLGEDYSPVAVRIHAGKSPDISDAEFEILKDGVSIMQNRDSIQRDTYGRITSATSSMAVGLTKGETTAESADDFKDETIESGGWLTCTLKQDGGGRNFTIQMELALASDNDETEE